MTDPVSVVDVAARAGVSLGTVSNVLNRPDRVSVKTRQKVMAAIKDLGFVRNEAARQLRAGRSRTVALVVLDIRNPFFTDLAAGAEQAAADAGLSVVLCNSNDDPTRELHHLSALRDQRPYGVLIIPIGEEPAVTDEIRRLGTPVVLVDRGSGSGQCSVAVNDTVGGELATAHLLSLGHRRVAFVGGPLNISQVANRLAGARSVVATAGLAPQAITVVETPRLDVASGTAAGERLSALPPADRPTAVLCANDLLALGVLQDAVRRQLSIPDDLAIVGYDDIEFAAAAAVPLTSVRQPRVRLGQAAMELLLEEATHPHGHRHRQIVFEPELVVRASTAGYPERRAS